jgi:hypothetical protein
MKMPRLLTSLYTLHVLLEKDRKLAPFDFNMLFYFGSQGLTTSFNIINNNADSYFQYSTQSLESSTEDAQKYAAICDGYLYGPDWTTVQSTGEKRLPTFARVESAPGLNYWDLLDLVDDNIDENMVPISPLPEIIYPKKDKPTTKCKLPPPASRCKPPAVKRASPEVYALYRAAISNYSNFPRLKHWVYRSCRDPRGYNIANYLASLRPIPGASEAETYDGVTECTQQADFSTCIPASLQDLVSSSIGAVNRDHFLVLFQVYYLARNISTATSNIDVALHAANFLHHYSGSFNSDALTAMCVAAYGLFPKIRTPATPTRGPIWKPFGGPNIVDHPFAEDTEHTPQAEGVVLNWLEQAWATHGPNRSSLLCGLAAFILCIYFKQTSDMPLDFPELSKRLQTVFVNLLDYTSWWEFFQAAHGYLIDGYTCWQKNTLVPFLTGGDYNSFRQRVSVLRISNEQFGSMRLGERIAYSKELYALTELGQRIKSRLRLTNAVTTVTTAFKWFPSMTGEGSLTRDIETLLSLKGAFEASLRSAQSRRAPLGVLITGGSSIGKTILSDYVMRTYAAMHDLPQGSEYTHTLNGSCSDEFMSGYTPDKWCFKMDDMGAINTKFQPNGDPMAKMIIDMINNVPYLTNQADLSSKGSVPFVASLVIATSNVKDFGATTLYTTPEAALRRLEYVVTPTLLPEYTYSGGLDRAKSAKFTLDHPGIFPPFWTFKVELVTTRAVERDDLGRPAGMMKGYQYQCVSGDGFTGPEFIAHFQEYSRTHDLQQDVVLGSLTRPAMTMCEHGIMSCCPCVECIGHVPPVDGGWVNPVPDITEDEPQNDELPQGAPAWDNVVAPVIGFFVTANAYILGLNLLCLTVFLTIFACKDRVYMYLERRRAESFMRRWTTFDDASKRKMLIASASLTAGVGALRLYYHVTRTTDANHADVVPSANESFAPWAAGYVPAANIRSGLPTTAASAAGTEHVVKLDEKFAKAVKRLIITKDTLKPSANPSHCHGLMVGAKVLLINTHSIASCGDVMSVTVTGHSNHNPGMAGTTNAITGLVSRRMRYEIPGTPYTLLQLSFSSDYKDLVPYFLHPDAQPGHAVEHWRWLNRHVDASTVINRSCSTGTRMFEWHTTAPMEPDVYPSWAAVGSTHCPEFVAGHSGSMWLSRLPNGTRGIIGLHEGISTTRALGGTVVFPQSVPLHQCVLRDSLVELALQFNYSPVLNQAQNCVLATSMKIEAADGPFYSPTFVPAAVHDKFAGAHLHKNEGVEPDTTPYQFDLISGSEGFRPKFKTAFKDSIMRSHWEALGYLCDKVPPVLAPGTKWKPEAIYFAAATGKRSSMMDPDLLRASADSFLTHIKASLPDEELAFLHPYEKEVAMYGAEGIKFVDQLNMSSGTGHGYKGTKRDLFNPTNPTAEAMYAMFNKRCDHITSQWSSGILTAPIYTTCLKDEPISEAKQAAGKIRVFSMSPVDATVAARQFLLSYCRTAQRNPFVFEQAVGMNCHSSGWGNIARYLYNMGGKNRQIAGDYIQFDCALQAALLEEVRRVLLGLFALSGNYSAADLRAAACAIADIVNPTVDFFGTIVGLKGMNPSGNMITVHVNGLSNSILLRYVFAVLSKQNASAVSVMDFRKHVHAITYGDDHVCGVSEEIPWYNQNAIAKAFAAIGIGYTDARKSTVFPDYEEWDDITFLKRRFIWSDDVHDYLAPLDVAVFGKMLCMSRIKNMNEHDVAGATLMAFVYEQFHHGRAAYDLACEQARECATTLCITRNDYPCYDARVNHFATTSATLRRFTDTDFTQYRVTGTKIPSVGDIQFATEGYSPEFLET